MAIITGYELLEVDTFSTTHSVLDRFKMFHEHLTLFDVDDFKFLLYCLETGKVFYW